MKSRKVLASLLVLFLLMGTLPGAPTAAAPSISNTALGEEAQQATLDVLRSAPLMFIENAGQSPDGARFQVRGGDRTIWLAEDAIWVTVLEPTDKETRTQGDKEMVALSPPRPVSPSPQRGVNLKLSFAGANPHPRLEPFDRLETHVSYFIGNDPEQWHTDVPVWGGVRYVDLYPGVDLEVTSERGHWTWRLVCGGADCQSALRDVRLRVEGTESLALTLSPGAGEGRGGGLRLTTALGEFTLPLLTVEGTVPAGQPTTFNVEPGTFDVAFPFSRPSQSLSVSPQDNPDDLLYSTFLGGSDYDSGSAITLDGSGSLYVTGSTQSSDFPTTAGAFNISHNGGYDAFVVKMNTLGTALACATFLGGSGDDGGSAIAVDGAGNAYITSSTTSSDFPTTAGAFDTNYNGGDHDAFVVKLTASGTELAYATYLGGSGKDWGNEIAVDGTSNAYLTGVTGSSDFPTTVGSFDTGYNGGIYDAFVAKLNASGTELAYATFLGGSDYDKGYAIAVDGPGSAYVTGITRSSNFPTTVGSFDTGYNGGYDAFVLKVNASGTGLAYATFLGGSEEDSGSAIALDGTGSAYVTGGTWSSNFPTTEGAFDTTWAGGRDAFVVKVNADGTELVYATYLGGWGPWGNDWDSGSAIALDGTGSAYVTGVTISPNFPTTEEAFDTTCGTDGNCNCNQYGESMADAFVVKMNVAGTALAYATYLGGSGVDYGCGIAVDKAGNAYVAGYTTSSDFPTTAGAFDTSYNDDRDAFVVKLAVGGGPGLTYSISGHVRDGSGNPISGVVVSAGAAGSATTDSSGAYTIIGLVAGTYTQQERVDVHTGHAHGQHAAGCDGTGFHRNTRADASIGLYRSLVSPSR